MILDATLILIGLLGMLIGGSFAIEGAFDLWESRK